MAVVSELKGSSASAPSTCAGENRQGGGAGQADAPVALPPQTPEQIAVMSQVEYYLSDSNYRSDVFLQKKAVRIHFRLVPRAYFNSNVMSGSGLISMQPTVHLHSDEVSNRQGSNMQ
jgi:hypothetical protein